jgi:ribosomal protein L21E
MSDNDSSFLGGEFQKLLVKYDIHHDPNAVGDHNSLGIIDNFAKRIKRILTAQFLQTKKTNWIDIIQKIVRMYNYSPHSSLGGLTPAEIMSGEDKDANSFIVMVNSFKSQFNGAATDLKIGDKVRVKLSGDFQKGTDPRYSGKVHTVKEIYGKNIILDNDKKYVRPQLLQVPADSVSDERPNTIQKAKKAKKVRQFLKSNDHTVKPLPAQLIRRSLPRKAKEKN